MKNFDWDIKLKNRRNVMILKIFYATVPLKCNFT